MVVGNAAGELIMPVRSWSTASISPCPISRPPIHNTGHYHVRPRGVCLVAFLHPICERRARPPQLLRLASLDLATRDARAITKDSAYRLQRTCAESAAGVPGPFFVRSKFGEGSRREGGKQTADRAMAR